MLYEFYTSTRNLAKNEASGRISDCAVVVLKGFSAYLLHSLS